MSLLAKFAAAVAEAPDRVALVDGRGRQTSFAELSARVDALTARWQTQGIGRGDRVLLAMPLGADLYASLAALWSLGATVVLPEPAMGLSGLRHAARITKPKAFAASGFYLALKLALPELWPLRLLRPGPGYGSKTQSIAREPDPGDIALISFTSGSTGAPKAIPRSHAFLMAQYDAVAPLLRSDQAERDLVAFPVFTLINLAEARSSILPNWRMSRLADLSPDQFHAWVTGQKVTRMLIPPALCETFLKAETPASLTTIFTGGGPVFPDLIRRIKARAPLRLICVYGSTEAEPIAHLDTAHLPDSALQEMEAGGGLLVGPPVPQTRLRIRDGEIQVTGGHVISGYLDPRHDAENKVREGDVIWHRTGDAGRLDADGQLWLLGRCGSEIKTEAGDILFPFAVETAARSWPGVRQAALMGDDGAPILILEADARDPTWAEAADALGVHDVRRVPKIPMDRRHASKIDRASLARML